MAVKESSKNTGRLIKRPKTTAEHKQNVAELAFPRHSKMNADQLIEIGERWTENSRPLVLEQALARLLLACAHYECHDAAKIHLRTGFPLGFVSLTIAALLRSELWLGPHGYSSFIETLADYAGDQRMIDSDLGELILHVFREDEHEKLRVEWYRAMGVAFSI